MMGRRVLWWIVLGGLACGQPLTMVDDCPHDATASLRNATFVYAAKEDLQIAIDDFCAEESLSDAECGVARLQLRNAAFAALGRDVALASAQSTSNDMSSLVAGLRAMNAHDQAADFSYVLLIDQRVKVPFELDGVALTLAVSGDDDPLVVARELCDKQSLGAEQCASLVSLFQAKLPSLVCEELKGRRKHKQQPQQPRSFQEKWASAFVSSCERVFIDLGSWSGDSIQRFSKPGEEGGLSRWLDGNVGALVESRKEFCVVGFEGNPKFTAPLLKLQNELTKEGFDVKVFTETVLSGVDGVARFFIDTSSGGAWGSSLRMEHPDILRQEQAEEHVVDTHKLSTVLGAMLDPPGIKKIIVKMDIEGAEYSILEDLLQTGLGCDLVRRGVSLTFLLELHPYMESFFLPGSTLGIGENMVYLLRRCGVNIITADKDLGFQDQVTD